MRRGRLSRSITGSRDIGGVAADIGGAPLSEDSDRDHETGSSNASRASP
jgi:hypothetical protein